MAAPAPTGRGKRAAAARAELAAQRARLAAQAPSPGHGSTHGGAVATQVLPRHETAPVSGVTPDQFASVPEVVDPAAAEGATEASPPRPLVEPAAAAAPSPAEVERRQRDAQAFAGLVVLLCGAGLAAARELAARRGVVGIAGVPLEVLEAQSAVGLELVRGAAERVGLKYALTLPTVPYQDELVVGGAVLAAAGVWVVNAKEKHAQAPTGAAGAADQGDEDDDNQPAAAASSSSSAPVTAFDWSGVM